MSAEETDDKSKAVAETQAVGYGRPPKRTRFVRGRSGNPKGRPKGSVSLQQLIRKQLNQRITVTVAGKRQTMTKKEAIAMTIVTSGLKSDPRAVSAILQIEALAENVEVPDTNVPLRDDEVVAALKRRFERALLSATEENEPKRGRSEPKPKGKSGGDSHE